MAQIKDYSLKVKRHGMDFSIPCRFSTVNNKICTICLEKLHQEIIAVSRVENQARSAKNLNLGEVMGLVGKSTTGTHSRKSLAKQKKAIMEMCAEYELPITAEHTVQEKPGLSGNYSLTDTASSSAGSGSSTAARPLLVKVVSGIMAGEIRCIVVWSLHFLATCVETMDALITTMVKYNCHFFDRHGPVDISSVEGRCRIYYAMAAAQTLREISHTDATRYKDYLKLAE